MEDVGHLRSDRAGDIVGASTQAWTVDLSLVDVAALVRVTTFCKRVIAYRDRDPP